MREQQPPDEYAHEPLLDESDQQPRTGADQPWDPEDVALAEGKDATPENVRRSAEELADEGSSTIDRTVP